MPDQERKIENELIKTAHQTIIELKKEIEDLKTSLDMEKCTEKPPEFLDLTQDANLVQTNDKIEVIERKFNAFETMYVESQNKFIESFRHIDERHKVYMDNIQETIKEIVEKSLGHHEKISTEELLPVANEHDCEKKEEIASEDGDIPQFKSEIEQHPQLKLHSPKQIASTDSFSQSEGEGEDSKIICQVDVHTVSSVDTNLNLHTDGELNYEKTTKAQNRLFKDIALNEFEQRLNQLGVDADSTGLATPRSCEVYHDLAEEREEMKKVCLIGASNDFVLEKMT